LETTVRAPQATRPAPGSDLRFCPRCGTPAHREPALCGACGEALAAQGYCAVCEAYWTLAPGAPCPKHELALEDSPVPAQPSGMRGSADAWVTVGSFADGLRAEAPRIRLEAEGIPTFLEGERMGSAAMYPVATGGVKLRVPASLAADARILLAQSWSTPADDDDLDDAWDDLEPDPGARWRDVGQMIVFLVLLTPLVLTLLAFWLNAS
jgi:hypothetical protein